MIRYIFRFVAVRLVDDATGHEENAYMKAIFTPPMPRYIARRSKAAWRLIELPSIWLCRRCCFDRAARSWHAAGTSFRPSQNYLA